MKPIYKAVIFGALIHWIYVIIDYIPPEEMMVSDAFLRFIIYVAATMFFYEIANIRDNLKK